MQLSSTDGVIQVGKDLWRSYTVHTKQGWWQRGWFASGIPGSAAHEGGASRLQATTGRLLGKRSLCENVGCFCLSLSIWSVWLQGLRLDFWIATSRNCLAFPGLPFTSDSSAALHGSSPVCRASLLWLVLISGTAALQRCFFFLEFKGGLSYQESRLSCYQFDSRAATFPALR